MTPVGDTLGLQATHDETDALIEGLRAAIPAGESRERWRSLRFNHDVHRIAERVRA